MTNALQEEYQWMQTGAWAEENPETCPCRGGGWCLSDLDTWHKCPIHHKGQPHPEEEIPALSDEETDALVTAYLNDMTEAQQPCQYCGQLTMPVNTSADEMEPICSECIGKIQIGGLAAVTSPF